MQSLSNNRIKQQNQSFTVGKNSIITQHKLKLNEYKLRNGKSSPPRLIKI